MFSKLAIFVAATMAISAIATPVPTSNMENSCNSGTVQCCNEYHESNSEAGSAILGVLGLNVQDVKGKVGFHCTPLSVIGTGSGSSCSSQPTCCTQNNFNGLVAIGCSPVNASA
ncbi:hypothetical protein AX17_006924 [Amanita inopinata Kibby_2008]|nr:hypothetical protein AX17_006924 [Amanita inopinata Kibby_2008]